MASVSQKSTLLFGRIIAVGILVLLYTSSATSHAAPPNNAIGGGLLPSSDGKHSHDDKVVAQKFAEEYQRIKTAAVASGISNEELEKVVFAINNSKLSPEQLMKLEEAILHNNPTPENIKKLMDFLAKQQKKQRRDTDEMDEEDVDWNKSGFDWLFKTDDTPKSASV